MLLEIKNSPTNKWTYKVSHLEEYSKTNTHILVFWNTGKIYEDFSLLDKINTRFGIIKPSKIEKMILTYPHYKNRSFGYKVCITVPHEDFKKWVKIEKLTLY